MTNAAHNHHRDCSVVIHIINCCCNCLPYGLLADHVAQNHVLQPFCADVSLRNYSLTHSFWPLGRSCCTTTGCSRHYFNCVLDTSVSFVAWQQNLQYMNRECIQRTVEQQFGACCRNLQTLNVWRAKGLTDVGLGAIADGCHALEELDAGWWSAQLIFSVLVLAHFFLSILLILLLCCLFSVTYCLLE